MLVPMKRLTLIALRADKDNIMSALQEIAAVHVISSDSATGDHSSFDDIFASFEKDTQVQGSAGNSKLCREAGAFDLRSR